MIRFSKEVFWEQQFGSVKANRAGVSLLAPAFVKSIDVEL